MSITVVFDPPLPSDNPATFNSKAFTLLGDLNDWSTQANALASDVTTKQSTASTAADTASTQAGIATTAANTATTQANNASNSASAALASEQAAAASYDAFDDRYLGAKASDPTLDNDGNALLTGALYWNSGSTVMRVWNGTAWNDVAQGTSTPTQTFSGTGAQTAFTLSGTPGSLQSLEVFISGVRQVPTTDYTVGGTTLTFVTAPPSGTNNIFVRWISTQPINVPADESVTTAKLADNAVTTAKVLDANITTVKIADGAVTTAKWASANGQLAGMRNKIINGKMEIAQRGTSFAGLSAGSGIVYLIDRYLALLSGTTAVLTYSQQADAPSNNEFQNSLRLDVTTADAAVAAGDVGFVMQRVEGYNARDLIGKTFTLSFWVRSSKTGVHCVSFRNSGSDRSYVAEYTVSVANTWEYKTITVSGGLITAGTWNWTNGIGLDVVFTLMAGSGFQTTANAWQAGSFVATANQVNCLDTVGNIFAITGVQLEVGSVATPFEHRPYGAELALCQRYYCAGSVRMTTYQAAGSGFDYVQPFPVAMRATPTIAYAGATYINASALGTSTSSSAAFSPNATATALGACRFDATYTATIEL